MSDPLIDIVADKLWKEATEQAREYMKAAHMLRHDGISLKKALRKELFLREDTQSIDRAIQKYLDNPVNARRDAGQSQTFMPSDEQIFPFYRKLVEKEMITPKKPNRILLMPNNSNYSF